MRLKKKKKTVATLAAQLAAVEGFALDEFNARTILTERLNTFEKLLGGINQDPSGFNALQGRNGYLMAEYDKATLRIESLERQQARDRKALDDATLYQDALGPLWTTQRGDTLPITLLRTPHLQAILDGGFANLDDTRIAIQNEIFRRVSCDGWDKRLAERKATLERLREQRLGDDACKFELKDTPCLDIVEEIDLDEVGEDLDIEISSKPIKDLRMIRVGGLRVLLPQKQSKVRRKSRIAAAWRAFWNPGVK